MNYQFADIYPFRRHWVGCYTNASNFISILLHYQLLLVVGENI